MSDARAAAGGQTWRRYRGADGGLDVAGLAGALTAARASGRPLPVPITDELDFSLADAYRVQQAVAGLRRAAGERPAGWKLGFTSAPMRAQMGIAEPNFGPLTTAMLLPAEAVIPAAALQPRTEPEIGLRLATALPGPCSPEQALAACGAAVACLEVVDSVWAGYRFRLPDNTADMSSAAWVAVGAELPLERLDEVTVTLSADGAPAAAGAGAAARPAAALAWLAGALAAAGRGPLGPGDLVITGGLTAALPVGPGQRIEASFTHPAGPCARLSVTGPAAGATAPSPRPWAR